MVADAHLLFQAWGGQRGEALTHRVVSFRKTCKEKRANKPGDNFAQALSPAPTCMRCSYIVDLFVICTGHLPPSDQQVQTSAMREVVYVITGHGALSTGNIIGKLHPRGPPCVSVWSGITDNPKRWPWTNLDLESVCGVMTEEEEGRDEEKW